MVGGIKVIDGMNRSAKEKGRRYRGLGSSVGIRDRMCHGSPMKLRLMIAGLVGALAIMGLMSSAETLAKADGTVSATKLPLDAKTAKMKFETATFGLG